MPGGSLLLRCLCCAQLQFDFLFEESFQASEEHYTSGSFRRISSKFPCSNFFKVLYVVKEEVDSRLRPTIGFCTFQEEQVAPRLLGTSHQPCNSAFEEKPEANLMQRSLIAVPELL